MIEGLQALKVSWRDLAKSFGVSHSRLEFGPYRPALAGAFFVVGPLNFLLVDPAALARDRLALMLAALAAGIFFAYGYGILKRRRLIADGFVCLAAAVAILHDVLARGSLGAIWCCPIILLLSLVSRARLMLAYHLALLATVCALVWYQEGPMAAFRIGYAVGFSVAFVYVYRGISGKQDKRLSDHRHRMSLLIRASRSGSIEWDAETNTTVFSPRLIRMIGHPRNTGTSADFFELVYGEDRAKVRASFVYHLRNRKCKRAVHDFRLVHTSGEPVWVHVQSLFVRDEFGYATRIISSFVDMTPLMQAKAELTRSHDLVAAQASLLEVQRRDLELLLRSTKAGGFSWDNITGTVHYSERFKEMLGYPTHWDTSKWRFLDMLHPEEAPEISARWHERIRVGPPGLEHSMTHQGRLRRRNGSYFWVQMSGVLNRDADGNIVEYACTFLDITPLVDAREKIAAQARQLNDQNVALRRAIAVRQEVERIARHDLRTPLTSIAAMPALVRLQADPGAVEEILGMIERSAQRVLRMVNLSLDLYRMEEGGYVFRPQRLDLRKIAQEVAAELEAHARSKDVSIDLRLFSPLPVLADELLCYSILVNLMKNALEAAPDGTAIDVSGHAGEFIRLAIHNAGAVPVQVRGSFFKKYTTLGKPGGVGLGTYSARLMARVQDGDLRMATSDTKGTTLVLSLLPASLTPALESSQVDTPVADPGISDFAVTDTRRVLVVDDDPNNVVIVQKILAASSLEVSMAVNGRAALDAVRAQRFDLVIMDLQMPVMGGVEALVLIRAFQTKEDQRPSVFIAFSAADDERARQQAAEAGFDGFLPKPASRSALLALLNAKQIARLPDNDVAPRLTSTMSNSTATPGSTSACPTSTSSTSTSSTSTDSTSTSSTSASPYSSTSQPLYVERAMLQAAPDYVESRRAIVAEMRRAAELGQLDQVQAYAHTLAGSFGLRGFEPSIAACQAIRQLKVMDVQTELRSLSVIEVQLNSAVIPD